MKLCKRSIAPSPPSLTGSYGKWRERVRVRLFNSAVLRGLKMSRTETTLLAFAWLIIPGGSLFLIAYYSWRIKS